MTPIFEKFAGLAALALAAAPVCAIAETAQVGASVEPGLYRIRAVQADWCVGYRIGAGLELPHTATGDCAKTYQAPAQSALPALIALGLPIISSVGGTPGYTPVAVIPHPRGGYTLRSTAPFVAQGVERRNGANRILSCLTAARNVVVGPARIDVLPCDDANDWAMAGGDDQRFALQPAGAPDTYTLVVMSDRQCVDVNGGSRDLDATIIKWECNNGGNQQFRLERIGNIATSDDLATIARVRANSGLPPTVVVPSKPWLRSGTVRPAPTH